MFKRIVTACIAVLIVGCTGLPDDVEPVVGFDSERYLGTWHEIARLDHSFERNLERVTATYGLNEDGSISVLNKGFNTQKGEWRQAEGVAKPMGSRDVGHLKVSFLALFTVPMLCSSWRTTTAMPLSRDTTRTTYGF